MMDHYTAGITELTLSGYSYVTFTVFEWMNRVHSDNNRISMTFKVSIVIFHIHT